MGAGTWSPALAANLLNAVLQAIAGTCVYAAAAKWTHSYAASTVALTLYAFSSITWTYAVVAEVFALNNALLALLLLLLVLFEQHVISRAREAAPGPPNASSVALPVAGAFVSGLALANQHTSVLALAVLLPATVLRHRAALLRREGGLGRLGLLAAAAVALLCGAVPPYAYLAFSGRAARQGGGDVRAAAAAATAAVQVPLAAAATAAVQVPLVSWGDLGSTDGFLVHALRQEYGTFQLTTDGAAVGGAGRAAAMLAFFVTRTFDQTTCVVVAE